MNGLLIRGAEVNGELLDVRIGRGRVLELGRSLQRADRAEELVEAHGGTLLPGLTDHHLHLFATAADLASVTCDPATTPDRAGLTRVLQRARPDEHGWIRGVRYHESTAGDLDATGLDQLRADVPVRLQHRSGALWVLNSRAAEAVGLGSGDHPGIERDTGGRPTGRLWRADPWLRARLPRGEPPSLAGLSLLLAGYGITAVTDASPELDTGTVEAISAAAASGELRQRVLLLGAPLSGSPGPDGIPDSSPGRNRPEAGPWKIVLADSGLPAVDELAEAVATAHRAGRPVAVHCVTRESLLLFLIALKEAGSLPGDRLEHASLVPTDVIPHIRRLGLRVVTQPGFLADRGDDFLRGTPASEHDDLYRCASLHAAGIPLGLSSDAPYGPVDPWAVMRAAVRRRTPSGMVVGPEERLTAAQALHGYLSPGRRPGDAPRRVHVGARADLVLLHTSLDAALDCLDARIVRLTLVGGRRVV
ncbi:amidohydrolase family protein [Streptomyces sp. NPDC058469]|uniref:amidohydrolase family protein n=1 Tax=Streptomyces sp. NPDC058469 TaxID=3346514 RepID=UPI00365F76FA